MSFVEWSNQLSIRVPEMDDQHQKLVAMLNEYHDAMKNGEGRDSLQPIMNRLISYTKTHLANEEEFLERIDYAFLNSHKTEHRRVTEQINDLHSKYNSGDDSIGPKLLTFLRDWLVKHIQQVDRMYGDYHVKQTQNRGKAKAAV